MKENYLCAMFLLIQWFSDLRMHQNHLTGLLKYGSLGPTPRAWFTRSGVVSENLYF